MKARLAIDIVMESFDLKGIRLTDGGTTRFGIDSWRWKTLVWVCQRAWDIYGDDRQTINFSQWTWNDGAGLASVPTARSLADALDQFVRGRPDDYKLQRHFTDDEKIEIAQIHGPDQAGAVKAMAKYVIDVRDVHSFAKWLRTIASFQIW